jgi:CRISPR type I-E-associated protein CasB/Cse2
MITPSIWIDIGRRMRAAYDSERFGSGPRAELKRIKRPEEVALSGHFFTLLARSGLGEHHPRKLAPVVWLFPTAEHRADDRFALGRYLRAEIHAEVKQEELPTRARRFRQLVGAHEPTERHHHLRRLLAHAYQRNRRPVDWGVIARDLVLFGDWTRRRWAEDFFHLNVVSETAPEVTDA